MSRRNDYGEQSDRTAALQRVTNSALQVFPDVPQHYPQGSQAAPILTNELKLARASIPRSTSRSARRI